MKTLFILRHAKSSWDDASLSDFERPLNERGLEAAPMMGKIMKKNNFQPDVIISSPAMRAKQTAALIKDAAQIDGEIIFDERIYEASPRALVQIVSETDDCNESAMIVGHNPGLENLIKFLTGKLEPMSTAALAIVDLEIDEWSGISSSTGNLRNLIRPKDEIRNFKNRNPTVREGETRNFVKND